LEKERKKLDEIIAQNEKKEAELRQLEHKLAEQEMEHLKLMAENIQKSTQQVLFALTLKF
jgi:dephospho-CoA kinase